MCWRVQRTWTCCSPPWRRWWSCGRCTPDATAAAWMPAEPATLRLFPLLPGVLRSGGTASGVAASAAGKTLESAFMAPSRVSSSGCCWGSADLLAPAVVKAGLVAMRTPESRGQGRGGLEPPCAAPANSRFVEAMLHARGRDSKRLLAQGRLAAHRGEQAALAESDLDARGHVQRSGSQKKRVVTTTRLSLSKKSISLSCGCAGGVRSGQQVDRR